MSDKHFIAHHRKSDDKEQSLAEHLTGVASKSGSAASKIRLDGPGEIIGLLHDLGKYSEAFRNYLKSAVGLLHQDVDEEYVDAKGLKGKIDHSSAGAQLLWQTLSQRGPEGQFVSQILALCVASHHSGLIDCLDVDGNNIFARRMGKPDSKTHLIEALKNIDPSVKEQLDGLISRQDLVETMIVSLREVTEKSKGEGKQIIWFKYGLLVRMLFSCLIDADRLDTADFERPAAKQLRMNGQYEHWQTLIDRLECHLKTLIPKSPIDHLRQDISRHCLEGASRDKGIFSLSVPTGGGKTLASLRFALHHAHKHGMDRVIYVVPFTSIIDQNASIVRGILEPKGVEKGSVVLEHHSNLMPEDQSWRDKILAENWDAPVIYTTMVQLLEALFAGGTRGARRMHQLANSVLVFDEIQALPVKCIHLFNNAMNFLVEHGESSVVLCTATQPLLHKVDPRCGAIKLNDGSELMRDVKKLFDDLKRTEVLPKRKPGGWEQHEIAELAITEARDSGSCLVIVNTKKAAQAIYQECADRVGFSVFHLSTSMCPAHRKHDLAKIREHLEDDNSPPVICVSTQLIEAGVDVDFGAVIRFAAGLDSIAQAAGRCNRNGKRPVGYVHVVNPSQENLGMLKDIEIGRDKAEWVMDEYREHPERFNERLLGPEAMQSYYEKYFFSRKNEMSYPVSSKNNGRDDTLLNMLSENLLAVSEHNKSQRKAPELYLRQSFMTAAKAFKVFDESTQGIIVPYDKEGKRIIADLCGASDAEKEYELLKLAQQYSVNVYSSDLEKLQKAGAVKQIQEGVDVLYLNERYYSKTFGLSTTPVEAMEVCIG